MDQGEKTLGARARTNDKLTFISLRTQPTFINFSVALKTPQNIFVSLET